MNESEENRSSPVIADAWAVLRTHTPARVALGRAGNSLPTREVLAFGIAHAQARDAVRAALDVPALCAQLAEEGWSTISVRSRAAQRGAYLARPDWGRRLDFESAASLVACKPQAGPDLVLVVADGLSATAVQRHAVPLLRALRARLDGLAIAPLVIATQARVALADEVGGILGARLVVNLIGERPGLSAPDSLGAYLTYAPQPGRTDAERNCISNIRPEGLGYDEASRQLASLIRGSLQGQCSGLSLHLEDGGQMLASS